MSGKKNFHPANLRKQDCFFFFWSDLEKQKVESICESEKNDFRDLAFLTTANSFYGFNR